MPILETDYCIEQINVPPKLPMILKQFCKSAIRTQPYDLLKWSSAYFHALANGDEPPSKLRLEYPPACSPYGLTLGFLKVLLRQLGADYNKVIPLELILRRWDQLCLDRRDSDLIILIGQFYSKCQIKKFLSIAVGLLTRTISETMILLCELFTPEPDGGSAMIPIGLFMEMYGYLASLRCDGAEKGSQQDICVCSDATMPSSAASESIKKVEEPQLSVASQDTDADVEAELELESFKDDFMKDDISGMTFQSFGEETGEESFLHEGEASYESTDHTTKSSRSKSSEDMEEESREDKLERKSTKEYIKEVKSEHIVETIEKVESKIEMKDVVSERSETKEESVKSDMKESIKKSSEKIVSDRTDKSSCTSSSLPCYPDVPGIGPKLLAEEVATVAIWMSECARRQGGMVGPRNIRHVNCPPLEGICCPQPPSCTC